MELMWCEGLRIRQISDSSVRSYKVGPLYSTFFLAYSSLILSGTDNFTFRRIKRVGTFEVAALMAWSIYENQKLISSSGVEERERCTRCRCRATRR